MLEQFLVDLKSARTDKLNTEGVYWEFFILAVHLKLLGLWSWYLRRGKRTRERGRGEIPPHRNRQVEEFKVLGSKVPTTKDHAPENSLTGNNQILVFRIWDLYTQHQTNPQQASERWGVRGLEYWL